MSIREFTGNFILHKTQFDIEEMNRLSALMIENPNESTRFYREKMGYTNGQLRTLLGYIDEIDGRGRKSYYS